MAGWKAATAATIFTPDEPMWLAGYAARTEPAKGKISDLRAKALALEDASDQDRSLKAAPSIGGDHPPASAS